MAGASSGRPAGKSNAPDASIRRWWPYHRQHPLLGRLVHVGSTGAQRTVHTSGGLSTDALSVAWRQSDPSTGQSYPSYAGYRWCFRDARATQPLPPQAIEESPKNARGILLFLFRLQSFTSQTIPCRRRLFKTKPETWFLEQAIRVAVLRSHAA